MPVGYVGMGGVCVFSRLHRAAIILHAPEIERRCSSSGWLPGFMFAIKRVLLVLVRVSTAKASAAITQLMIIMSETLLSSSAVTVLPGNLCGTVKALVMR